MVKQIMDNSSSDGQSFKETIIDATERRKDAELKLSEKEKKIQEYRKMIIQLKTEYKNIKEKARKRVEDTQQMARE